ARWLEARSPAPQAHALNLLFDKVENMVCGAILKKYVDVQATSTGAGTFDLACSRQNAQKYVDKLNDHCPHGPDAFAVLPSQDPWKLAEECWPHLDWDVEASAAWRDFASLRSQCRELLKAKAASENKGVFCKYVHSCLSETLHVDLTDRKGQCEIFNGDPARKGAWTTVSEKIFAEKYVLPALKTLPLDDPRFAKSLVPGIYSLVSQQSSAPKLDGDHAKDKLLFRNGVIWDFASNSHYKARPEHRLGLAAGCDFDPWMPPPNLPDVFDMICEWLRNPDVAKLGVEESDLGKEIVEVLVTLSKSGCELLEKMLLILETWTKVLFMGRNFSQTAAPCFAIIAVNYLYGPSGAAKDTVSKLLFSMLGDYAMVLDGDKVLSSSSSGPSLEQWCQGKRMVVGTEIGDKKSLNFSFLKRLVEREGLPVSAKGSHEALQNWSSHTAFWFTSNHLMPFWQDDAMSQKVNLWTFDRIFDAEPIGFQEQATDFVRRINQGEFHGQMQWLVFGMARTLHRHVNPANRLLPRPAEMSDAVARLRKETN
ncbi:unnamed protein product, partial [Symbiodinium sp. CCMP2456]